MLIQFNISCHVDVLVRNVNDWQQLQNTLVSFKVSAHLYVVFEFFAASLTAIAEFFAMTVMMCPYIMNICVCI